MGSVVLLDTNVLIATGEPGEQTPDLSAHSGLTVSSLSFSELVMGIYSTRDLQVFRQRWARYQGLTNLFGPGIPYDDQCVNAYQRICAHVADREGDVKARRIDRMIAATALAHGLTVATRDLSGFQQLGGLITVVLV
ncbi:MAG: PIN domain-containing protein [Propionibacteriaceae bacterium]|jgi:predicted nucleic acid-binding protein|nr:PIN domain-containing protein [Propionibacteriaceae bacterium]